MAKGYLYLLICDYDVSGHTFPVIFFLVSLISVSRGDQRKLHTLGMKANNCFYLQDCNNYFHVLNLIFSLVQGEYNEGVSNYLFLLLKKTCTHLYT